MLHKICRIILICGVTLGVFTNSWAAVAVSEDKIIKEQTTKIVEQEKPVEKVNVNTADVESLQKVKYMSKKKASSIIEYRSKYGIFKVLDDLLKVNCRGIHKEWLVKVSKYLTL